MVDVVVCGQYDDVGVCLMCLTCVCVFDGVMVYGVDVMFNISVVMIEWLVLVVVLVVVLI